MDLPELTGEEKNPPSFGRSPVPMQDWISSNKVCRRITLVGACKCGVELRSGVAYILVDHYHWLHSWLLGILASSFTTHRLFLRQRNEFKVSLDQLSFILQLISLQAQYNTQ